MKKCIVKCSFSWKDAPDKTEIGGFVIGCDCIPEIDEEIVFYFADEKEYEKAKSSWENDFKIIDELERWEVA